MARLLHVAASSRGSESVSRRVAEELIDSLRGTDPDPIVVARDLAASSVPHPDHAFVTASLMPDDDRGKAEHRILALSEMLIGELEAADIVVLSMPMHNFTVPSALKAWLDHIVRPGRTFTTTAAGKTGLLADRQVFAVIACGGRFGTAAGAQCDFLSPYLRYVLGTIGLSNIELFRIEELNRGRQQAESSVAAARRWIEQQTTRMRLAQ